MKLLWMLPLICGEELMEVEAGVIRWEQAVRAGLLLLRLHHRLLVLVVTSSTAGSSPPVGRTRTSLQVVWIHYIPLPPPR